MHKYQQTLADLEREAAPGFLSIIGGAVLFLAAVLAFAFVLSL